MLGNLQGCLQEQFEMHNLEGVQAPPDSHRIPWGFIGIPSGKIGQLSLRRPQALATGTLRNL